MMLYIHCTTNVYGVVLNSGYNFIFTFQKDVYEEHEVKEEKRKEKNKWCPDAGTGY
jgi:hypothetical protein